VSIIEKNFYKELLTRQCKAYDISPQKPRFNIIEDIVTINIKNHLKEGVDLECFTILHLIHQTLVPLGIKFDQQLTLYPDRKRLDRVTISFSKNEYIRLNKKLETGDIN